MKRYSHSLHRLSGVLALFGASTCFATPYFSITPVYLPTHIATGGTAVATYTITNNTGLNLTNMGIKNLYPGLSQSTTPTSTQPPVCSSPISLTASGAGASCTLQITVSTPINNWLPQICATSQNPVYCSQPTSSNALTVTIFNSNTDLTASVLANQGTGFDGNTPPAVLTFPIDGTGNIAPTFAIEGSNGVSTTRDPQGVYIDNAGNLWVMDLGKNGVELPSVKKYALDATGAATPIVTIQGSNTGFGSPAGLAIDNAGTIYIADIFNQAIYIYSNQYQQPGTYNHAPTANISGSNTNLDNPVGIAFGKDNRLYVANSAEFGGTHAGLLIFATSPTGNVAPQVQISLPGTEIFGVALDPDDNIWLTDFENNRFLKYPANPTGSSTPICTITGSSIDRPVGIAVNSNRLWVTMDTNPASTPYVPGSLQQYDLPSSGCTGAITLAPTNNISGPINDNLTGISRPLLLAIY